MRRYIYIGIGGAAGAISRYALKTLEVFHITDRFYLNTLAINITGCFVLAFFLRLAFEILDIDPDLRLGVTTGFIGAFTTFSTFCRDTVNLLFNGDMLFSFINILLSLTAGFAAIYIGDMSAKKLIKVKE